MQLIINDLTQQIINVSHLHSLENNFNAQF